MEFSAKQIAEYIHGEIVGNEHATVHTFAKIEEGVPGAISFLSNPKYTHYIYTTQSTIVLVNKDFEPEQPVSRQRIRKPGSTPDFIRTKQAEKDGHRPAGIHCSNRQNRKRCLYRSLCLHRSRRRNRRQRLHPSACHRRKPC